MILSAGSGIQVVGTPFASITSWGVGGGKIGTFLSPPGWTQTVPDIASGATITRNTGKGSDEPPPAEYLLGRASEHLKMGIVGLPNVGKVRWGES